MAEERRRRLLHRTGLLTLLVGGAIALSGCWGIVLGPDQSGYRTLVMTPAFTNQIVKVHCGGRLTESRARCVLRAVWDLCRHYPLPRMPTLNDCSRLTGGFGPAYIPGLIDDMHGAIAEVIHLGKACLVARLHFGGRVNWDASYRGFACN